MPEPITTIIAAVTAAKGAFEFVKSAKEGISDVQSISKSVTDFLQAEDFINKEMSKSSSVSVSEQLGFKKHADLKIQKQLMKEQRDELRFMLDTRFYPGFFQEIVEAHAKEKEQIRIEQEKIKKERIRKHHQLVETVKIGSMVFFGVVLIVALLVTVLIATANALFDEPNYNRL